MNDYPKSKSPFFPGQPVPVDLFVGRAEQINQIRVRGAGQVAAGKPMAFFVQGEYGIGKSSIANFAQRIAEQQNGLHAIYAQLGGAKTLEDVARVVLEAAIRSGVYSSRKTERVKEWLAKYVGQQELFGITLNLEALKADGPSLSSPFGMLGFLTQLYSRLKEDKNDKVAGLFLVLDEINGITANPDFAHFIKGLVEQNALSPSPVPLLLMLCGVPEKRREMIDAHQPVERTFDVLSIERMSEPEMADFFNRAFLSVGLRVENSAMSVFTHYSAGFPKIMHHIGDAAYWTDNDGVVDRADADRAVLLAAEEIGRKYVDQQVLAALRSDDYRSILRKIASRGPLSLSFQKREVESGLNNSEKRKFSNFLQKMKKLKVLSPGDSVGEYVFHLRMVLLYIWMQSDKLSK